MSSPHQSPHKSPRKSTPRKCKKLPTAGPGKKNRRKLKVGTHRLREIQKYQGKTVHKVEFDEMGHRRRRVTLQRWNKTATCLLIPKASFQKLVREIAVTHKSDIRFTVQAVEALQHAAESHLVTYFQDANVVAVADKRETLMSRDMQVAAHIRRDRAPLKLDERDRTYYDGKLIEQNLFKPRPDGVPHGWNGAPR